MVTSIWTMLVIKLNRDDFKCVREEAAAATTTNTNDLNQQFWFLVIFETLIRAYLFLDSLKHDNPN